MEPYIKYLKITLWGCFLNGFCLCLCLCHCHCHCHCHHHRHISWAEGRSSEHTLVTGQINALFFVGNFYPFGSNILVLSWNHDRPFAIWEAPKISILLCFSPQTFNPPAKLIKKTQKDFHLAFLFHCLLNPPVPLSALFADFLCLFTSLSFQIFSEWALLSFIWDVEDGKQYAS